VSESSNGVFCFFVAVPPEQWELQSKVILNQTYLVYLSACLFQSLALFVSLSVLVAELTGMGFSEVDARRALRTYVRNILFAFEAA
jgi:hypothetical protein